MRHIPFLQALAEVSGTDDPVWRDASAGYLVLRLFDRWLEEGSARISADTGLEGLRARIHSVLDVAPQVRDTLLKAIQEMVDAEEANPAVVAGSLLEYGKYLELAGRLELAGHVYQTLIDALDTPNGCIDPLSAAMAHMQYAYLARFSGDYDASDGAYQQARTLADQAGSKLISLRARLGMVNTLKARGNLGDAEELVDQVLAESIEAKMVNCESWALHTRGIVRTSRGRYVDAMIDFFRAYELTDDTSSQEMLLCDLAGSAWEAGYRQMARDSYRIVAYTAREPIVRSLALINLLEYATYDSTLADFERIQTHLAAHIQRHPLPADLAINLALHRAYGVECFGTHELAIAAYRSVISEAHSIGSYQIEFKAEKRLMALMAGTKMQDIPLVHEPPDTLRYVVDTIAELSAIAEVSS